MSGKNSPVRRADAPWIAIGVAVALAWWGYQMTLPPVFRGMTCCDAQTYRTQARMIVRPVGDTGALPVPKIDRTIRDTQTNAPSASTSAPAVRSHVLTLFTTLLKSTAVQLPGYPAFLAFAILLSNATGGAVPWIPLSLGLALILHAASAVVFVSALRRTGVIIPGWTLAAIIALPASVSLAASPLSDSLATSILLFALAGTIWVLTARIPRETLWAAFPIGLLWSSLLWTRSSHLPTVAAFFALLLLWSGWAAMRRRQNALLPLGILCAGLLIGFLPRIIACTTHDGRLCVTPRGDAQKQAVILLREGLRGARTYTVIQPTAGGMILTIPDAFFASLQPACNITMATPRSDLLRCMRTHWWKAPWFAIEKLFGLFDQSHLNPHATYVTPPWMRWTLRLVTLPVLIGFLALLVSLTHRLINRRLSFHDIVLFGYFPLHAASILPFSIEQRYGLPLLGIGFVGFGLLCTAWRRWSAAQRLGAGVVVTIAAAAFMFVTASWDAHDPVPYIPIITAAASDALTPYEAIIRPFRVRY